MLTGQNPENSKHNPNILKWYYNGKGSNCSVLKICHNLEITQSFVCPQPPSHLDWSQFIPAAAISIFFCLHFFFWTSPLLHIKETPTS